MEAPYRPQDGGPPRPLSPTLGFDSALVLQFVHRNLNAPVGLAPPWPLVGLACILHAHLRPVDHITGVGGLNSKTILLIEDNPSDIELTKRALERSRIANQLVVAEDGQEALDYLHGTGAHRRPQYK